VLPFSIPGNKTSIHYCSNSILININCTINYSIHLSYRVFRFISQAVCLSDKTTHGYLCKFSAPAGRFCSSDNTTRVYFCSFSKFGKRISLSVITMHVYFCNFCLLYNAHTFTSASSVSPAKIIVFPLLRHTFTSAGLVFLLKEFVRPITQHTVTSARSVNPA
jgi:hypothetical protein